MLKNIFFAKNPDLFIFNKFTILRAVIVAFVIIYPFWTNFRVAKNETWKTNLYGSYNVDSIKVEGINANTLQDSSFRFTKLYFDITNLVNVKTLSGEISWENNYLVSPDSISIEGKVFNFKGKYVKPDSTKLNLTGISKNKSIEIFLNKFQ